MRILLVPLLLAFVGAAPATQFRKDMKLTITGRPSHPTVYLDRADIERGRRNRETAWGKVAAEKLLKEADQWASKSDDALRSYIPAPDSCYAYGFSGCPNCTGKIGTWGAGSATFDDPGHVKCANGHRLPDADHPDVGKGWTDANGKKFYFVGSYNAFVIDTLTTVALDKLTRAYALTGDAKYATKAALILDELARIYPTSETGSWDYPSTPPSGRFNRPWYQVARMLIHYADHYDVLLMGDALDSPSSVPNLTKRQNIEQNLLLNGAKYCFDRSLEHPSLNNGQCDYIRGCMVVGVAMGIAEYVKWAVDGPTSIRSMVENNIDRDGQYYETSTLYSHHTRYLYMDIAEILHNYTDADHPDGIHLADHPKFRAFYLMPQSRILAAGVLPLWGDDGPKPQRIDKPDPIAPSDLNYLERLMALTRDAEKKNELGAILVSAVRGDVDKYRSESKESDWLIFHADDLASEISNSKSQISNSNPSFIHPLSSLPLESSDLLAQKGVAVLRSGAGENARAAMLRFGPTLNHGQFDELTLSLFARGYDLTYYLGYGVASTHTQVGFAKQTASHNTVLVDETSQLKSTGSGGSLLCFADLPGLKLVRADSPHCYSSQGVTQYDRTLAMIDISETDSYVLDIFRIAGGKQHDYVLHSQGTNIATDGLSFSEPQKGSLAGEDVDFGARLGVDGDVIGIANKPYWVAPPGNGFGFLLNPARADSEKQWSADWTVDQKNPTHLRLTMLPGSATQVVRATAPGIYPNLPKAAYILARRKATEAGSTFAAVMEPYNSARSLNSIALLTPPTSDSAAPVAVKMFLIDGRTVYLLQSSREMQLDADYGPIRLSGGFAKITTDAKGPVELALIDAASLTFGDITLTLPAPAHSATIDRIDFDKNILYTSAALPPGQILAGQFLSIANPAYSRTSSYRIQRIDLENNQTAIHLAPTTLLLARAHMDSPPPDASTLPNVVPLEYAKSPTRKPTLFFNGKAISTPDGAARTLIRTIEGGGGTTITVDSSAGFPAGTDLLIHDIQPGDTFALPCFVHLRRDDEGHWQSISNSPFSLNQAGSTITGRSTGAKVR